MSSPQKRKHEDVEEESEDEVEPQKKLGECGIYLTWFEGSFCMRDGCSLFFVCLQQQSQRTWLAFVPTWTLSIGREYSNRIIAVTNNIKRNMPKRSNDTRST